MITAFIIVNDQPRSSGDWPAWFRVVALISLVLLLLALIVFEMRLVALIIRDTRRCSGRWGINRKRIICARCRSPQPFFRMPASRRQWWWGGCTCKQCGCEMDKWGVDVNRPPVPTCVLCGGTFEPGHLIAHGELKVCARCKPIFLQKLAEGATIEPSPAALRNSGGTTAERGSVSRSP